jgi:hypothetical protein
MTNAKKNEEIIELTDVVEEEWGPDGRDRPRAFSPPASEEKISGSGPDQRSDKNLKPPMEESRPSSQPYESQDKDRKETLRAGADEWMASEGVRVLERIAREMFPKIAREVLGQEIEKLKAQVKEQE